MTTTLNASTAGAGGFIATSDNSGILALQTAGTTAVTIDTSQRVGIGTTTTSNATLTVNNTDLTSPLYIGSQSDSLSWGGFFVNGATSSTAGNGIYGKSGASFYYNVATGLNHIWTTNGAEKMRIDSSGNLLVKKTSQDITVVGAELKIDGQGFFTVTSDTCIQVNRLTSDGALVNFRQDTTVEGSISVSGTTVSYNGGHLSRYAQTTKAKDESLVKGTVLSNLDAMNVYTAPTTYWTEEDELPEGVNVGDVKVEIHEVANEQLNKVKVSDVEGDANVAGVFVNWSYDKQHSVDEINMAMTGDMIIRIAQGVTVQRGDLLMSAGDGTAKAQGDDIVRAKTIAKVTSNHVTCTYADGSYCVPCVLMAC